MSETLQLRRCINALRLELPEAVANDALPILHQILTERDELEGQLAAADSQRLRAEAARERDEAIPNRVFEQIIELQRKYSEAKYSFSTRQTANNVLAELAALLAPATEEAARIPSGF